MNSYKLNKYGLTKLITGLGKKHPSIKQFITVKGDSLMIGNNIQLECRILTEADIKLPNAPGNKDLTKNIMAKPEIKKQIVNAVEPKEQPSARELELEQRLKDLEERLAEMEAERLKTGLRKPTATELNIQNKENKETEELTKDVADIGKLGKLLSI